jgi:hypothetical protein
MIIRKKKGKACVLTDVAIPADRNVTQKAAEKLQYSILCTEIQQMYDHTGNDWSHRNSNKTKHLEAAPGKHSTDSAHHTSYGKYCSLKLEV